MGADGIIDVDLAALRASPWSKSMMAGGFAGDREQRLRQFGYDVFEDAERMLVVSMETGAEPRTLTIARGRFDAGRLGAALSAAAPGATATRWRDSPVWEGAGRSVALVTPRTVVHGDSEAVRGAVDAAWSVVPDASGGKLGELRRSLAADQRGPSVFFALGVSEGVRRRAAGTLDVPPQLRQVAGRLDLGDDLDLDAVALFDDRRAAAAAAGVWSDAIRQLARQRMLMLLGLAPLLADTKLAIEGTRVRGHLHVPADKREGLADKLSALLQMVAGARK
jgi:hypothetical protein